MKRQPVPNRAKVDSDVIGVLGALGTFKTLLVALQVAGLTELLRGGGPLTLFAPNDTAFSKISSQQLQDLLTDRPTLIDLLRHHLVLGHLSAADIIKANVSVPSAADGRALSITVRARNIYVNDAQVVKTDIQASNGLIHTLDHVIMELPELTLVAH